MELVYLWVEKYKNIENKGFNFSPRFTCSYDNDSKELTIDKNKDCLKNFFGKNINVTAIVGENGSGKSSIFKIILYLFTSIVRDKETVNAGGKYFLIIKTDSGFRYLKNNFSDIYCNIKCEKLKKSEADFYTIYVNYMLDSLKDHTAETWVEKYYYKNDNYETPVLFEPNKKDNKIDLDNLSYLMAQRFDWQFLKGERHELIKSFFNPTVVVIEEDREKIKSKLRSYNEGRYDNPVLRSMTFEHTFVKDKTYENLDTLFKLPIAELEKEVDTWFESGKYSDINMLYFALKILGQGLVNTQVWEDLVAVVQAEKVLDALVGVIKKEGMEKIYENIKNLSDLTFSTKDKLRHCIRFAELKNPVEKTDLQHKEEKLNNRENFADKLLAYPMWIKKTYYEEESPNGKTLDKLSSGEKTYLKFLMMLVYEAEQIRTKKHDQRNERTYHTMNLLLDEIELSMHPNWQKRLLNDIVTLLKPFDLKFNIFLTSHSPFILSDLPKENVVFLKKGEQVNPTIDETFGANIHTLLSHGFFMKDGLMGEFAKGKIEDVINYLNDKESTIKDNDKAQKILNIIGEPIIKNQLQRMLDSKRLSKVDKIDKLEEELELIKHRIEMIRKNQ